MTVVRWAPICKEGRSPESRTSAPTYAVLDPGARGSTRGLEDVHGFRNDFQFTGHDPVAERNVVGMVLEVPNADLGAGDPIRIWGRTMAPVEGEVVTVDQAGRPGTNDAFNEPEEDRLEFDATPPTEQLTRFRDRFLAFLESLGYSDAEAADHLPDYLPDVLRFDPSQPPGYPNGRRLTDDTADLLASLLTRGRVTSDPVGPHTDLLDGSRTWAHLIEPEGRGVGA
jgi:hypothetical protein